MNVNLNEKCIIAFKEHVSINTNPNCNNKRNPGGNREDPVENKNTIVLLAFNLSTKLVEFGNDNTWVTTVAYEIRFHLDHVTLLKININSSIRVWPHIYFQHSYSLHSIRLTSNYRYRHRQNSNNLTEPIPSSNLIVHIINITKNITNSWLKERLLTLPSVIVLGPTYLTERSGKWLVVVKKSKKDQTRTDIDQIITDTIFPDSQVDKPGWSNCHNIKSVLVSCAAFLQKEAISRAI